MKGHKNNEEEKDVKAVTENSRRRKAVRENTQKEAELRIEFQKAAAQQEAGVQSSSGQAEGKSVWHHEDLALKTAVQYFGEELMPLLGIKGKAEYIAPTEIVKLEARDLYQDFNYAMKEKCWVHLKILQTSQDCITQLELEKMQAVLYTFADKFLTGDELNNVKEVLVMTKLGQMIFNDGIEEGLEKGIRALILDNLEEGVREERILEKLQKRFSLTRTEAAEKLREYKTQL